MLDLFSGWDPCWCPGARWTRSGGTGPERAERNKAPAVKAPRRRQSARRRELYPIPPRPPLVSCRSSIVDSWLIETHLKTAAPTIEKDKTMQAGDKRSRTEIAIQTVTCWQWLRSQRWNINKLYTPETAFASAKTTKQHQFFNLILKANVRRLNSEKSRRAATQSNKAAFN